MENGEAYARGLYLQGDIAKCLDVYKTVVIKGSSPNTFKILQGKALYHRYIEEQRRLKLDTLTIDLKSKLKESCFRINRQVIEILGRLFDESFFSDDDEAAYMLDRAMMDCIFKANMLDSCKRCYLCRRNLQEEVEMVHSTPRSRDESQDLSQQEQSPDPQKKSKDKKIEKLIKSHIIPRSILEQLCGTLFGSKQVLLSTGSSIRASEIRLLTPAELAYYMLCPKCEGILSANGEAQFSLNFFRKLYSLTDKHWVEVEQDIEYGPWLHQFCVGLIFRALHWDVDDYTNSSEIYAVLRKCRAVVMQPNETEAVSSLNVSLFISPLSVGHYEQPHGYMNTYLRGGMGGFFGPKDTSDSSTLAYFFVVHFGVVNIVVEFGNYKFKENFKMFTINPSGGIYHVFSEKERKGKLPQCIWSCFQEISSSINSHFWASDSQISKSIKEQMKYKSPEKNDPFDIGSGLASEALTLLVKHLSHEDSHEICLLPPEFSLKSTSAGKLMLPKGHTVLLHANYVRGEANWSTFFIAIGNSKKYPIHKPYVIWHFHDDQTKITCGAFFSPTQLCITEFLASGQAIETVTNISLAAAKERMPTILKDLLTEKGFSSMASLLQRVKSAVCIGR